MTTAEDRVVDRLRAGGRRLALAESCTGGLLAARVTDRAGASRYFQGALVTYSNAAKERLLGVRRETLEAHGAVSREVAGEMLDGALAALQADTAVAITGIAGPDGGTPEKPVGTVWIGVATTDRRTVQRFHFPGDRGQVRDAAVAAALDLLARLLEGGGS